MRRALANPQFSWFTLHLFRRTLSGEGYESGGRNGGAKRHMRKAPAMWRGSDPTAEATAQGDECTRIRIGRDTCARPERCHITPAFGMSGLA